MSRSVAPVTLSVLGAGSWGTALASLLAGNGQRVRLWGRDAAALAAMAVSGENVRYLPGIALPPSLEYLPELAAAVADAELVLLAVPSHAFDEVLQRVAPLLSPQAALAWASKGFDPVSGR
ncbi:nad h-dependent glycerol-3-phosphate dehydrogenase, partial [Lasius niger]